MFRIGYALLGVKYWWQRHTRGYDDLALWNPDHAIASYALPLLKEFRKNLNSHPDGIDEEAWDEAVDEMIFGLEYVVRDEGSPADAARADRGLELFGKHFQSLWD